MKIFPLSPLGKVALILIMFVIIAIWHMMYHPDKWTWLFKKVRPVPPAPINVREPVVKPKRGIKTK